MPGARGIRDQMQGVAPKSYGAPLGPAQAATGVSRPTVGQAPLDVQRRAIAAQEAEASRQARAGLYQKPVGSTAQPVARPQPASPSPTRDLSVQGAAQKIQGRSDQIDQAVNNAS